jgi:hypothetical protein
MPFGTAFGTAFDTPLGAMTLDGAQHDEGRAERQATESKIACMRRKSKLCDQPISIPRHTTLLPEADAWAQRYMRDSASVHLISRRRRDARRKGRHNVYQGFAVSYISISRPIGEVFGRAGREAPMEGGGDGHPDELQHWHRICSNFPK